MRRWPCSSAASFPINIVRSALLSGMILISFRGGASAQPCSLSGPVSWALGGSGSWTLGANWSSGAVPDSPTANVCITNGLSTVSLNASISVGSLQLAAGNTLSMMPGADLPIAGPQIIGAGNLDVNAGSGSNTILSISQNVTLTDPVYTGAVTLNSTSGGATYIEEQATRSQSTSPRSRAPGHRGRWTGDRHERLDPRTNRGSPCP